MKIPKIYIIVEPIGDRYHLWTTNYITWFFDQREAEDWVEKQPNPGQYQVEEVEGGEH
jgi:hypothetical protein